MLVIRRILPTMVLSLAVLAAVRSYALAATASGKIGAAILTAVLGGLLASALFAPGRVDASPAPTSYFAYVLLGSFSMIATFSLVPVGPAPIRYVIMAISIVGCVVGAYGLTILRNDRGSPRP